MIKYKLWWDRLGIAMSVVCLVHCLMLPLAIAALPLVAAQWLEANTFHTAMALALVPVALFAAVPGLRMHGRVSVGVAMAAGLSLLSTAAFAGERLLSQEWVTGLTVVGGTILVTAHAVNLALCRSCPACATPDHEAGHR
jgi:carbon starvation protein CstA